MEGQDLLSLVKGRIYNSELRSEMLSSGLRRLGTLQWINKETGTKFELVLEGDGVNRTVKGLEVIEENKHVSMTGKNVSKAENTQALETEVNVNLSVHHKTARAIQRQLEISDIYYNLIEQWNDQMSKGTALGEQLKTIVGRPDISWEDFIFLPDPTASGSYIFGSIEQGKAASLHSWLDLPDGRFIVPTDGTPDGAFASLQSGKELHKWEFESFTTAAAAGQFVIKMLNCSQTTYAGSIRRLLGKEAGKVTRNDFYRNDLNEMCRIEIISTPEGRLVFNEIPALPTLADCLECLLAPYIKARALRGI